MTQMQTGRIASPVLWVTTFITKGSALGTKDSVAAQQGVKESFCCRRWNNGFCPNNLKCHYAHWCSACKGKHPRVYCSSPRAGEPQTENHQQKERASYPPPKTKYKLAIVNTIVPLAFPSIGLDQSEVMNELRETRDIIILRFATLMSAYI